MANKEKTLTVAGFDEPVLFRNYGGQGYTQCKDCSGRNKEFSYVAAAKVKSIKKCHCGKEYPKKTTAKVNPFNGLNEKHYKLIITLAEYAKEGKKLSKPEVDKPTAEDYRKATAEEKVNLDIAHDEWEVYDSTGEMTPSQMKKLESAAKALSKDE